MVFLKSGVSAFFKIAIAENQTYLTILSPQHTASIEHYFRANAEHLAPWDLLRCMDFYSTVQFGNALADTHDGVAFQSSQVFPPHEDTPLHISLNPIQAWPLRAREQHQSDIEKR